jgi:hypothetical protein
MIRAVVLGISLGLIAPVASAQSEPAVETSSGVLSRAPDNVPQPELSPEQRQLMFERYEELMERSEGVIDENPPGPPGNPLVEDPETAVVEPVPSSHGSSAAVAPRSPNDEERLSAAAPTSNPGDLVLGKIVSDPNPVGQTPVVEPGISNMGQSVFYLSNNLFDYSSDGGTTFTSLKIPGGPSDAPNFCCDQTIVFDPGRSIWLWSALYTNTGSSNGIVKLGVIRNPGKLECTYVYDPGGTANNILPDYPQLGLSDNNLYLATSEIQAGSWLRSRMLRFDLDKLLDCPKTIGYRGVDFMPKSKRMWAPVRGARGIMYWANHNDANHLRIWTWPESDKAPTSVIKKVQTTTFADPDCRGGANDKDWIQTRGWQIADAIRGALARGGAGSACPDCGRLQFYWNAAKDSKHKQAFVRSAVFDLPGLNVLAEPNVHNKDFCYGYADVHPNARGDLGATIAFGGRDGGGGRALAAGVAIEDEYTTGYKLETVYLTTDGTDMPSSKNNSWDQRYGDYLSVKPHDPCSLWWVAGNYALSGGGGPSNVVANYVEFGRQRDKNCWDRWSQVVPKALP